MNLSIGTKIQYSCAAGTRVATVSNIRVGPTALKGFMITWLTLDIPVQKGVKLAHTTTLPADNGALKMFQVAVVG